MGTPVMMPPAAHLFAQTEAAFPASSLLWGLPLTEQEALERLLANPAEDCYADLFRATAPRVFAFFRTRGCDPTLAEDLTQDVMLTVFRQAKTLRDKELFRPWLYRIARNVLLQHVRTRGRRIETVHMDDIEAESAYRPDPLLPSQFQEWMAALEPDERQIMMLRYIEELEYHEIAEALDLPLGTVQWKIFHSKKKLAAKFK